MLTLLIVVSLLALVGVIVFVVVDTRASSPTAPDVHCFHDSGVFYAQRVCCHCGFTQRQQRLERTMPGHGPHLTYSVLDWLPEPPTTCPRDDANVTEAS